MYRGAVHLVLYRFVYHFLVVDGSDVEGLGGVLHFNLSAFLLYLQVSGQFHIIIGMVLLFGFNLPETHHRYFFASSFTDFWRRIRTDWKDFMMKIFYYPIHFKLRKYGEMTSLVITTLLVFILTWLLHAYQWFWLRGTPLVEWHDILFWTVFALLVLGTSIWESKRGRRRTLGKRSRNAFDLAAVVLNTVCTFLTISVLWGLWSSASVSQWLQMWQTAGVAGIVFLALIPTTFGTALVLGRIAATRPSPPSKKAPVKTAMFARSAVTTSIGLLVLCMLYQGPVYSRLPQVAGNVMETIREDRLNERDRTARQIGYYEHLTHGRHNAALWETYNKQPSDWGWDAHPHAKIEATDLRGTRFAPHLDVVFKGAHLTTNSRGMRDKEYAPAKPPETYRIAILGPSNPFGAGVADAETFDNVLEARIAAERTTEPAIEVLNFSVPEGEGTRYAAILDMDMLEFAPDAVIVFEHMDDAARSTRVLVKGVVQQRLPIPYPRLKALIEESGVTAEMTMYEASRRLRPYQDEILEWSHRFIAEKCKENGIVPIWALLPKTFERLTPEQVASHRAAAEQAGFHALDLLSIFDGRTPESLRIADWDSHANALGHQLIADRLYEELFTNGTGPEPLTNLVSRP